VVLKQIEIKITFNANSDVRWDEFACFVLLRVFIISKCYFQLTALTWRGTSKLWKMVVVALMWTNLIAYLDNNGKLAERAFVFIGALDSIL
jgi:hypothetical protein